MANPLQYSCLENPRDGGAWWAAISGVVQSRTRLKQLSSSSSSFSFRYLKLASSIIIFKQSNSFSFSMLVRKVCTTWKYYCFLAILNHFNLFQTYHDTNKLYHTLIPRVEEPGRLQSMGLLGVRHNWVISLSLFTFIHWKRKWQPTPVFLPGESQGWRSLVGCHPWGCTESDMTEVT